MVQRKAFTVFADYHQFYLGDPVAADHAPLTFTAEDVRRRIKAERHLLVVQPERDMTVPVEVEVHDADPGFDPATWDHIAEASLHLPTGYLQVWECTGGTVAEFAVRPGWYRVRCLHGGLGTLSADGLDGGDHYRAVLWPAPPAEVRVVKQWAAGE